LVGLDTQNYKKSPKTEIMQKKCRNFVSIMSRIITLVIALLSCAFCCRADVNVSLLTASPGAEVFELEGHTALRVVDTATGLDRVVHWGVFDFNTPHFIYRFVKGECDYMCGTMPTQQFIAYYMRTGRSVTEQPLALTQRQALRVQQLLDENLLPQNRTYRYNYVKDNCATRPLNILERVVGSISEFDSLENPAVTFRSEMMRYHSMFPWYQFGIDLALGSGIDYPLTRRETAFAPLKLEQMMARLPIVNGTTLTYGVEQEINHPTPWPLRPIAVMTLVALIAVAVSVADVKCGRVSAWFDSVLFGAFFLAGCLITFLVFVSTHEATSPNVLIWWLNPFCLLGAVLPWLKSAQTLKNCYFFANFAVIIILCAAYPLYSQVFNIAFWPLLFADLLRSGVNIYVCRRNR
jgi:hypothetical protein